MRIFLTLILVGLTGFAVCACAAKGTQQSNDSARLTVPKVTYCDLIKDPERFHNQVVEVTAVFEQGFEKSYLSDKTGCQKGLKPNETWVGFDQSFVTEGDSEEAQTNKKVSGFGIWSLTAIGRFRRAEGPQRFGHLGCCRFEFALMKIVKSEKLSDRAR